MPQAGSVWIDVLPSFRGFSPALARGTSAAASKAGDRAGTGFSKGFVGKAIVGIGALAVGRKLFDFVAGGIEKTTDAAETLSKSNVIFGKQAADMRAWASTATSSMGITEAAALGAASSFGDMFTQLGFTGPQAAKQSQSVVQLATDLGSFSNVDTAEVMDMISASFRGEFDSLQRLVPNINAARVAQEAMRQTGKKSVDDLTAQEKATATLAIITRDAARAQGDFKRTADGQANASRVVRAQIDTLQTSIGEALAPAVLAVTLAFRDNLLPALQQLADKYGPQVSDLIVGLVPHIETFADKLTSIDLSGVDWDAFTTGGSELADTAGELGTSLSEMSDSLPSLTDALNVAGVVFGFLADHSDTLADAMPALVVGIVAFKVAQAAANVAALAAVPLRIAELAINRQLVASNLAMIGARSGDTAAQTANNGARSVGLATMIRQRAVGVASAVWMGVTAVATGAWTAAQWLLNAALNANPLGLIVLAIGLVVGALVLAWKKSETFQRIVKGAFEGVQTAAQFMWEKVLRPTFAFIVGAFLGLAGAIVNGAARAFGWVPGIGPKLRAAADKFNAFKDDVNAALDGVEDKSVSLSVQTNTIAQSLLDRGFSSTEARNLARASVALGGAIRGPGSGTSDSIAAWLSNGEHVWTAREVRAAGGHGAVYSLRAAALQHRLPRFAGGGAARFDVHALTDASGARVLASALSSGIAGRVGDWRAGMRILDARYDRGGLLPPGLTLVTNGTRHPEAVLTSGQLTDLRRIADGAGSPREVHLHALDMRGAIREWENAERARMLRARVGRPS